MRYHNILATIAVTTLSTVRSAPIPTVNDFLDRFNESELSASHPSLSSQPNNFDVLDESSASSPTTASLSLAPASVPSFASRSSDTDAAADYVPGETDLFAGLKVKKFPNSSPTIASIPIDTNIDVGSAGDTDFFTDLNDSPTSSSAVAEENQSAKDANSYYSSP
jgi:hypothetical protein